MRVIAFTLWRELHRVTARSFRGNGMLDYLAEGLEAGMRHVSNRFENYNGNPTFLNSVLRDNWYCSLYLIKHQPRRFVTNMQRRKEFAQAQTSHFPESEKHAFEQIVKGFPDEIGTNECVSFPLPLRVA